MLTFSPLIRLRSSAPLIWKLPKFGWILTGILIEELVTNHFPLFHPFPTVTRVGIVLLAVEIFDFTPLDTRLFFTELKRSVLAVFLASFLTTLSLRTGVADMVLALWEPSSRSTLLGLLTFMGGIGIGMVTGNFSASFFALATALNNPQPLLRAALMDGVLAGILLSPFSLFNLVPAAHYQLDLRNIILLRMKQLSLPILIGALIYAVGSIRAIEILRPVTFIFLALVVMAVKFYQADYQWRKLWGPPEGSVLSS